MYITRVYIRYESALQVESFKEENTVVNLSILITLNRNI